VKQSRGLGHEHERKGVGNAAGITRISTTEQNEFCTGDEEMFGPRVIRRRRVCDLKKRKSDKLPVSSEGGFESTGRGVPFGHTRSGMHNANR